LSFDETAIRVQPVLNGTPTVFENAARGP